MSANDPVLLVDTPEALHELCGRLADAEWLAVDTEFLREKTYYPKLCLIQLGTPELSACVDPLALPDLGPLLDLLYDPRITKVFHACHQDLEIFYHLRGTLPGPVFDTQIAAPLLGHPEQMGYAGLVEALLDVKLDKAHARADWSRRPLPEEQLRYAVDDVVYLARLYPLLRRELVQKGRLEWLNDDFAGLTDPERYASHPDRAWLRLRAAQQMRGERLAALQGLAAWREETARAEDKPRGWLLRDEVIEDLARTLPKTPADLSHVRGLHEQVARRHGPALLACIGEARGRTPEPRPAYQRDRRHSPTQEALVEMLEAVVHSHALELKLNPAILAPRKSLERLAQGEPAPELTQGWRRALVGENLQAVLRGERALVVEDGRLRLIPVT